MLIKFWDGSGLANYDPHCEAASDYVVNFKLEKSFKSEEEHQTGENDNVEKNL